MKRSEMVERLATFLDHDYSEDAEAILNFLENAGMLPPDCTEPSIKTQFQRETWDKYYSDCDKVILHKWEPEDE